MNPDVRRVALPASPSETEEVPGDVIVRLVLASLDDDGDGSTFGDADRVGFWREINDPKPLDVEPNQTVADINFALLSKRSYDSLLVGNIPRLDLRATAPRGPPEVRGARRRA